MGPIVVDNQYIKHLLLFRSYLVAYETPAVITEVQNKHFKPNDLR
jgi:hypothetical protein